MSEPSSDRNALFDLLAVRIELLGPETLAEAVRAWERDPGGALGRLLGARGLLQAEEIAQLKALVEQCLKRQAQGAPVEGTLHTKGGAVSATLTPASGGCEPP